MNSTLKGALIGAAATLFAAGIGGYPVYKQNKFAEEQVKIAQIEKLKAQQEAYHYRQSYINAPKRYTYELGKIIMRADEGDVITNAKALVATRNDLRSSLVAIGARLDTEIDALESELKKPDPDKEKVRQLVEILKQKWPAKDQQIEVEVRKLLAEMGMTMDNPPNPPPDFFRPNQ